MSVSLRAEYLLVIILVVFMFPGCASHEQVRKDSPAEMETFEIVQAAQKTPGDIRGVEVNKESEPDVRMKIEELKQQLLVNGVPGEWFDEQIHHDTFQFHPHIGNYFRRAAERQIDHEKKYDVSWYFALINVDARIEKGKTFIEKHISTFEKAEARHGIDKELIAAIIGIETTFADHLQRGKFYAFNSLVSQYLFTNRKKFAVREITSLYKFSQITGQQPQYFTSSYAGAIGWGQFIPSSLLAYFIDTDGIDNDIDPFSIEDTIISVENYLYKNNLTGKNIHDYDSKYKAVFAYNHSDVYVKAVLYIYDGLRDYFRLPRPEAAAKAE